MKKMYIVLALSLCFIGLTADAALTAKDSTPLFDLQTEMISKISGTNVTIFDMAAQNITDSNKIGYWKVRLVCDKNLSVSINTSTENNCGKAVNIAHTGAIDFSLLFKNTNTLTSNFSVKLKAYDVKGKWLHTDTENFRWK